VAGARHRRLLCGAYLIVNYGEGVVKEWEHDELARLFREDAC
jgi:5'-methylthioadenosine phosphorylase